MKDYFLLQFKMTNRKLKEVGINPLLAYVLGIFAFVLISEFTFQKTTFAKYILPLVSVSFLFKLSEKNRTDFLRITFGEKRKNKIRVIENFMVCFPFLTFLIFKNAFFEAAFLFILTFIYAVLSFQTSFNFSIPTPFSKHPFEFAVGFRKTFFMFPIAYMLTIIAINVDNLNLGIFAMLLLFLTAFGYYTIAENEYYVWIHADTPQTFLMNKMATATKNIVLVTLPIVAGLLIYFQSEFELILLGFIAGIFFMWTIILAKYSAYPDEISLPEGMLFAFSIYFPPMLLAILPFFYIKSVNKLKVILNDKN